VNVGAVGIVARRDIRRRWRSVVALTLMVGVVGAVALATVAGARRTSSALARFEDHSRSADVELAVVGEPTPAQLRALSRVRGVAAVASLRAYAVIVPRAPDLLAIGAVVDRSFGVVMDRDRIVAGRSADPSVADEITIGEGFAAQLRLRVGGHLDVESYSPGQVSAILAGGTDVGRRSGPSLRLRIVGIARRPLDLGNRGAAGGLLVLTPAFNRAYADRMGRFGTRMRVRTDTGAAEAPRVIAAARSIFGTSLLSTQGLAIETEGARNAIDVLALALWIFAGVSAVAGVVAIGIVLTREISLVSRDQATLRALGLTRRQTAATKGLPVLAIAGGGALLAVFGAVVASPLLPVGVARRADPNVGLHADWAVLTTGVVATAVIVLAVAFFAAVRATGRSSAAFTPQARRRTTTVIERAAGAGLRPTVTNGLRLALQPGRGRTAVPIRSAFFGAAFGVLGVTAVLVFASNLDHLVATPRLYGWTWDFKTLDTSPNTPCGAEDYGLSRVPGVAAVAEVCYQNVDLDGRPAAGLAFTSRRGQTIDPEVVAGRAPRGRREVALGSTTLHALGKGIGDMVKVRGRTAKLDYRIVGRVVFPTLGQAQPLADGAAFTGTGFSPLFDQNIFSRYFVGSFATGADREAVERRIAAVPQLGNPTGPTVPVEVDRLRQVDWFPAILAALLGSLALLATGHALVATVPRRRRELALLKTLGFNRRQVRATVAWQATTVAIVGLVVGIPAGLVVGRFAWGLAANGLGISMTSAVPVLPLLLAIPAALALVNLTAFFPARAAAHTRPAVALQSE
jgi:hypothetical protein